MSNEKERSKKIPIIVAIIGAIGVIIAALIGIIDDGPELSTVQGIVTDTDGMPVAGAVVEINGFSATTDNSGVYVIHDVLIGTKTITVHAPGAEVITRALIIAKGGEIIIFDITLPPTLPLITPTLSVAIIYPRGEASSWTNVEGTVSRALKEGEYMWIAVNPFECPGDWWPQTGGPIIPSGRTLTWRGRARIGGEKQDIGKEFEIAVLIMDADLNSKFKDWQRECVEKEDWPSITNETHGKISKGVIEEKIFDQVTVVLKEG